MQALHNPENSRIELSFAVNEGNAHLECHGDGSQITICTKSQKFTVENTFTLDHEGMLRLAFKVLGRPEIKDLFPHAALPGGLSEDTAASKREEIIKGAEAGYRAQFGEPDHFGKKAMLRPIKDPGVVWGDALEVRGAQVSKQPVFKVTTTGDTSLAAMVDVLVAFVRDSQTQNYFPAYSIPYMRRWGEEAFVDGQLKEGLPYSLTKDVHLKQSAPPQPTVVREVPSLRTETILTPPVVAPKPEAPPSAPTAPVNNQAITQALAIIEAQRIANEEEAARLESLRAELAERSDSLDSERASVESAAQNLELEKGKLTTQQNRLASKEEQLNARGDGLDRKEAHLDRRNSGLDDKQERIRQREAAVAQRESDINARATVPSHQPQRVTPEQQDLLTRQEDALRRNRVALEERENDLNTRTETFERQMGLREEALANGQKQLEEHLKQLALAESELNSQRVKLEEDTRAFEARCQSDLAAIDQKVEAANAEASRVLASRQEELDLQALELEELRATLESERADLERDAKVQREQIQADYDRVLLVQEEVGQRLKVLITSGDN